MNSYITKKVADKTFYGNYDYEHSYRPQESGGNPITYDDIVFTMAKGFLVMAVFALVPFLIGVNNVPILHALGYFSSIILISFFFLGFLPKTFLIKHGKKMFFVYAITQGYILGVVFFTLTTEGASLSNVTGAQILLQALLGTIAVFLACLFLYKTKIFRVKNTKMLYVAVMGFMIVNIMSFLFGVATGFNPLWDNGALGVIYSVAAIALASMLLVNDFGLIDEAVTYGVDKEHKWVLSLGLLSTIIWIFFEMIRLLSILSRINFN